MRRCAEESVKEIAAMLVFVAVAAVDCFGKFGT